MEVHGFRIVAQWGQCTQVNFTIVLHLTLQLTQHTMYTGYNNVGINDRKSQLHEKTRNIKVGMLVCLQINLSLDGHLTYQHCNLQAVSVVPSGRPPNKPTLYPTANVHGALRMPGIQLMLSLLRPVIDNLPHLLWCIMIVLYHAFTLCYVIMMSSVMCM